MPGGGERIARFARVGLSGVLANLGALHLEMPCGAALAAELAGGYEPVFLSEPRGMLEIWRPRTETARR